jgi:NAD+ diphosphatase
VFPVIDATSPLWPLLKMCWGEPSLAMTQNPVDFANRTTELVIFGQFQQVSCYFGECLPPQSELKKVTELPQPFVWMDLRSFGLNTSESMWKLAATAAELRDWHAKTQFCGRCAMRLTFHKVEYAKVCPKCRNMEYPRLSPAVIVAIVREDRGKPELLLAHNLRFPGPMRSIIAGFIGQGESAEETIIREIKEEVNLEVTDVRYFGSECWPFPNSLMLGFTARYLKGELKPDGQEIDAADWYSKENMPPIPPKLSISRRLIDWFLETRT